MRQGRILVVEPSRTQAEAMVRVLTGAGYEVSRAEAGSAPGRVRAGPPDVILASLAALGGDLRTLAAAASGVDAPRGNEVHVKVLVPVIVVSASAEVSQRVEALTKLGAHDFLSKPFADAELLARVEVWMRVKRQQDELRDLRDKLEQLSVTDGLTGIHNHRHFQTKLREEVSRASRYASSMSLVMFDLDEFKSVNDRYGHPFGDQVLRGTAEVIQHSLRVDVDFCARYGGEEFAVILPSTALPGATVVAARILAALAERVFLPEGVRDPAGRPAESRVTCSAGVASFPGPDSNTPEQLVKRADDALYRAKGDGRNCVWVHTDDGRYRRAGGA